jgi:uncharacterized protein (DUF362 family)/ferredoxin
MRPRVVIADFEQLEWAIAQLGGWEAFVPRGARVLLKPNICAPKTEWTGAVTSAELVGQVIRGLQPLTREIAVGDSPFAGYHCQRTMRAAGITQVAQELGAQPLDFNASERVQVPVPNGRIFREITVVKPVAEADVLINMPVMKTHILTLVTLSMKNMKGVVPGSLKHEAHRRGVHRAIVDINRAVPSTLVILDADVGMEGNGPANGFPRPLGKLIVGTNVVAVDAVAATIMGVKPADVKHLRYAARAGLGPLDLAEIDVVGMPNPLPRPFVLPRAYFSPLYRFICRFESPAAHVVESFSRIEVDKEACQHCRSCLKACPQGAISWADDVPRIDHAQCSKCLCCVESCLYDALDLRGPSWTWSRLMLNIITHVWRMRPPREEEIPDYIRAVEQLRDSPPQRSR